jgi:hypothetical protein
MSIPMLSPYYYKLPENVTLSRFLTGVVEGKKYFKTFIISMSHLLPTSSD